MEKIKKLFAHKVFKILKWAFLVLLVLYIILVVFRVFYLFDTDKTNAQVEKIHNTKLSLDDVMGVNLPPDPGADADKTVRGIDANDNGIRDDVELAVFKAYPDSAKTRAVLLQYALAIQMEMIQPIVNKDIVIAVTQEGDRAYQCIGEILVRDDSDKKIMDKYFKDADLFTKFVENKQFNTDIRKKYEENFLKKIGSYNSLDRFCDIDYSKLPN
ncbi:MAG: hypothetical protein WAV48_03515 [Candidatus Magasanikiibacteriota bacterium]